MVFKTREHDGESVISSIGCLFLIWLVPIFLLFSLIRKFFEILKYSPSPGSSPYKSELLSYLETFKNIDADELAYRKQRIPKKDGSHRELSIPSQQLKAIQKEIDQKLQPICKKRVHSYAHAYQKHRDIKTNAQPHIDRDIVIKLDIRDFFGSISPSKLKTALKETKLHVTEIDEILKYTTFEDGLPQGAPTSPLLSNVVMYGIDIEIKRISRHYCAHYTRYADDITLSLMEEDSKNIQSLISGVTHILNKHGFEVHTKKGKRQILRKHQAQRVCGVTINSGKPTVSRKQRRLIRAAQHRLDNGLEATFTQNEINGWVGHINHIHGIKRECVICNAQKKYKSNKKLVCQKCGFSTNSSRRLKNHWSDSHPRSKFPKPDLCNFHKHYIREVLNKLK